MSFHTLSILMLSFGRDERLCIIVLFWEQDSLLILRGLGKGRESGGSNPEKDSYPFLRFPFSRRELGSILERLGFNLLLAC
jgi:hypothetical protein